jgi:hypothetical protein
MHRAIPVVALLLLSACDSGPGLTYGDPQLRVLEGDDQTHAVAEVDSLDQPVSAQLYQTATDGITFRIVPELHAQTNVRGVKGHQVCAVPVSNGNGLKPWNPCNVTDTAGVALFFFEPGTKAGRHCAEIRAVVDNAMVVTDSVCATVEPGPVAMVQLSGGVDRVIGDALITFSQNGLIDAYNNFISYTVQADSPFVAQQAPVGTPPAWGIKRRPNSQIGDSGEIRFLYGSTVIFRATGHIQAHPTTPEHWRFRLTW